MMIKHFALRLFTILTLLGMLFPNGVSAASAVDAPAGQQPQYLFPIPGSTLLNPQTSLILRYASPANQGSLNPAAFQVQGDFSGAHPGRAALADDGVTVTFTPFAPFSPGETVHVSVSAGWVNGATPLAYTFQVDPHPNPPAPTTPGALPLPASAPQPQAAPPLRPQSSPRDSYLTLPPDFPKYTIDVAAGPENQGYIFLAPFQVFGPSGNYLLMIDNTGDPVYYQRLPDSLADYDFKKQPNGMLTYFDSSFGGFTVLNSSYQVVATYSAVNGYMADVHDFQLLPNNHGVFLIYDTKTIDMSTIVPGGNPAAQVTGLVIQELDGAGNLVFEWRSWDHFLYTDAENHIDLTAAQIDYVHGNAIQLDWDGNYLLSSRHLCEVTKIDRRTGDILWRLGGENNQFTFTNVDISSAYPFCYQHDIRRLPDGNITLFDNRNTLTPPYYSRAVEYQLNEDTRTITQVWEYRSTTPDTYSIAMGNAQRLDNANTLIGWGFPNTWPVSKQPDITEVSPDGSKVFELTLPLNYINYRAFRFTWQGSPTWPPTLAFRTQGSQVTLGSSWNGDTHAARYQYFAGPAPSGDELLLGTADKTGFETQYSFTGSVSDYCYFQAVALDSNGDTLQASPRLFTPACLPYKLLVPFNN